MVATAQIIPSKKPRKKKFFVALVVTSAVVCGAGYSAAQAMLGPAEGTVITTVPLAKPVAQPVELEQFDGKHISLVRPVFYAAQPPRKPEANSLESYTFIASGMATKVLIATVMPLPSGRLEDEASYTMRTLHPSRYKITELKAKNEKVMVAVDAAEHQTTAFWPHGNKLLMLTLTGISTDTPVVQEEYYKMIHSVVWR